MGLVVDRSKQSWRDVHGDIAWLVKAAIVITICFGSFVAYLSFAGRALEAEAKGRTLAAYDILVQQGNGSERLRETFDLEVIKDLRREDANLGKIISFKFRKSTSDVPRSVVTVQLDVVRKRSKTIEEIGFRNGKGVTYIRVYPRPRIR
jgi:hypothetical protein